MKPHVVVCGSCGADKRRPVNSKSSSGKTGKRALRHVQQPSLSWEEEGQGQLIPELFHIACPHSSWTMGKALFDRRMAKECLGKLD
jgi:hypothetical protein